jgi:hypothetical protein
MPNPDDSDYLVRIAQSPAYASMFSDPQFSTFLLTVYTTGGNLLNWVVDYDDGKYDYERTRVFRLAYNLINQYPHKTFILLNWEGDHQFRAYYDAGQDDPILTAEQKARSGRFGFLRWIQARTEGVEAARNSSPDADGRVFSALEVNCDSGCGNPGDDSVAAFVGSRVRVDYISYSSWQSLGARYKDPAINLTAQYRSDIRAILAKVNNRVLNDGISYGTKNMIIGEYGFYRDFMGDRNAADSISEMFDAAESSGVSYAIYWQIKDDPVAGSCCHAAGLFTFVDGNVVPTLCGQAFMNGLKADRVWIDDAVPLRALMSAEGGDSWTNWVTTDSESVSGSMAHQSNLYAGLHEHAFANAHDRLFLKEGDILYAFVYLDPVNPPSEVMLQWSDGGGVEEDKWAHRAYWGSNIIDRGVDGTESRFCAGPLPTPGQWVRLKVPASAVGLEGHALNGMSFTLFGGQASWDRAGKLSPVLQD